MAAFLQGLIPNVLDRQDVLFKSIFETLLMVGWSGIISFFLGAILGILLVVTAAGGILQNTVCFHILDKVINFFRSIPFIILLAGLMDLTRLLMGTGIGVRGAIVPLVFGTVPFYARQIENALSELDYGQIEAAKSMGSGPVGIIFRVYLRESIAPIVRSTAITTISLIGLTAMAGVVGAGGMGDFAIRYGYNRGNRDITYISVIILVVMVAIVQMAGDVIIKKTKH